MNIAEKSLQQVMQYNRSGNRFLFPQKCHCMVFLVMPRYGIDTRGTHNGYSKDMGFTHKKVKYMIIK